MGNTQETMDQLTIKFMKAIEKEQAGSESSFKVINDFYQFAQAVEKLSNSEAKQREADAKERELSIRQQEADSRKLEAEAKAEELKIKQQEADAKARQVTNDEARAKADQQLKAQEIEAKKLEVASRQKAEIKKARWETGKVAVTCAVTAGLTVFCTMASEKGWFTSKAGLAQVPKIRF